MEDKNMINDYDNSMGMDAGDNSKAAGRWTTEEHRLFLQGLQVHSKQWKLIADMVKTRTVVQIRTHAQKYFQKLEKLNMSKQRSDSMCTVDSVPMKTFSPSPTSRANSITSDEGPHGLTSSEGESDGERSPKAADHESAAGLKISFPVVLMTKQNVAQEKKKGYLSPRKRSRDARVAADGGAQAQALSRSKRANRSCSDMSDVTSVDFGPSTDPFDDMLPFVEVDDDLDHSIYHLMEKIDWHAEEQQLIASSSSLRPSPPFLDGATTVAPPVAPSFCSAAAAPVASLHQQQPLVPQSLVAMPGTTAPGPQLVHASSVVEPRAAYSSVLDEFKLLIDRCNSAGEPNAPPAYAPAPAVICQQLPSLRALGVMSSGMKMECGGYGYLPPMSASYYHYPVHSSAAYAAGAPVAQVESSLPPPPAAVVVCASPVMAPRRMQVLCSEDSMASPHTSVCTASTDSMSFDQPLRVPILEEKLEMDEDLSFLDYAHC